MSNHKLVQKTLKITAVGAIAFSVLAQPLSFVANAAETTSSNKVEGKLLQTTVQSTELLLNNVFQPIAVTDTTSKQFFPNWQQALVIDPTAVSISAIGSDTQLTLKSSASSNQTYTFGSSNPNSVINQYYDAPNVQYRCMVRTNLGGATERVAFYQDIKTVAGKTYTLSNPTTLYSSSVSGVVVSDTNTGIEIANTTGSFIAKSNKTRITVFLGRGEANYSSIQTLNLNASPGKVGISLKETIDLDSLKADIDALFLNDTSTSNAIKTTTDQASIDALQAQINKLEASTTKTSLQNELNLAQQLLNARIADEANKAAATAAINDLFISNNPANHIKDTTTQAAIDAAQAKVNAVTDVTTKADLQAQVNKAQAELNERNAEKQRETDATTAINNLFIDNNPANHIKDTTTQAMIDAAQTKVDAITDATKKAEMQAQVDKAQSELNARVAEKQREADATASIKDLFINNDPTNSIKDTTNQAAIDAAQAKVNAVTDATVKADMQAQVDKAQSELNKRTSDQKTAEATTSVDNLFIDNNSANHIKDTTNQAAIDAAQAKVNAVTDATAKADLQTKVDKAQTELNARTAETQREAAAKTSVNNLFINNDPTNHIKDTTTQALIDAAQTKVNAVTDATVKAELQAQVDKAQAEFDAKKAEQQRETDAKKAINDLFIGNDPANNIKETTTQAAVDAAQAKVDAITDPTVKAELQKQIDKAQSQLDGATPVVGTAAKYTVGDLYITGTYTGPATALSLDVNGKRYYGGEIKDGKFKFYALDKSLKVGDVVKLNLYNANKEIKQTINIQVVEPLKVTVADYKIGDNNLTATYNNPDITQIGLVVDGKKYWGGEVADGKVKYYALDKIKSVNSVVTMNFYDASNNIIATKQVKLLASYTGEITTADFKVGENNITGAFTGDVKQVAISVNGTKYYGGTVTAATGTYKFYVLDKKIQATDTVIVYGYDPEGKLLTQKTVTIAE
ncbi:toxin Cry1Ac domain D-VI-related protein [Listeria booriae]|uniref:toxin Cry1Ac domain D-VI-related protein n=1 Tax=Listeria booriae TaxID=1552123 RepID=UPI001626C14E|nr:toxin Cry1Ac domain D-VI-related protein [Listeria booriae]MBC1973923.1 hypothetical protein [Listeria booriae]MBC2031631.1 hypothetical protein [Listeria booriae]MBC2048133.1 hypothetical protein [Listeria booriae]